MKFSFEILSLQLMSKNLKASLGLWKLTLNFYYNFSSKFSSVVRGCLDKLLRCISLIFLSTSECSGSLGSVCKSLSFSIILCQYILAHDSISLQRFRILRVIRELQSFKVTLSRRYMGVLPLSKLISSSNFEFYRWAGVPAVNLAKYYYSSKSYRYNLAFIFMNSMKKLKSSCGILMFKFL